MARGNGSSTGKLLLVLAVLVAAGGYNYHRNLEAEAAEEGPRPYQGYSEEDIRSLLDAYRSEAEALEKRYHAARGQRVGGSEGGMLDENIRAFESARQRAGAVRELGAQVSMRQAAIVDLEEELARREAARDVLALHLKRLLTI
jgi:hypothetical protein